MSWSRLVVNLGRIGKNCEIISKYCSPSGITITGVAKGLCADPRVVRIMIESGCEMLGDSRMQNLVSVRLSGIRKPLVLLRIPMISEIPEVVRYSDMTVVSSVETLFHLEKECSHIKKEYEILVMVDLGDLREGLTQERIEIFATQLSKCRWVKAKGVAVNFACFGGVLPDREKMEDLLSAGKIIESILQYPLEIYSGGATSSLALLEENMMPSGINNLRIGEGILLGTDISRNRSIPYLNKDTMYLEAEIIETAVKRSVPFGTIGADAFGNVPSFENRGMRKRAIAAVGRQDLRTEGITPMDDGVDILGASGDHLVLDVEESCVPVKTGSLLRFSVDYPAMLALATSPYISFKVI
jgi:predicted amino acid racemase